MYLKKVPEAQTKHILTNSYKWSVTFVHILYTVGRSNSPSEDSAGTGDELQSGSRPKRRSLKKKGAPSGSAFYLSDPDLHIASPGMCVFLHRL